MQGQAIRFIELAADRVATMRADARAGLLDEIAQAPLDDRQPVRLEVAGLVARGVPAGDGGLDVHLVGRPGRANEDLALAWVWLPVTGTAADLLQGLAWRRTASAPGREAAPAPAPAGSIAAADREMPSPTIVRDRGAWLVRLPIATAEGEVVIETGPCGAEAAARATIARLWAWARRHPAAMAVRFPRSGPQACRYVAVIGSRDYPGLDAVARHVGGLDPARTVLISGAAAGVDTAAETAALEHGIETLVFRADWGWLGRRAGPVRNEKVIAAATEVLAFWNGSSRGTLNAVALALGRGLPITVFGPEGEPVPVERAINAARHLGIFDALAKAKVTAVRGS